MKNRVGLVKEGLPRLPHPLDDTGVGVTPSRVCRDMIESKGVPILLIAAQVLLNKFGLGRGGIDDV